MVAATARLIPLSLRVVAILFDDDGIAIRAVVEGSGVCCPVCGESSHRIHSRAIRTLADLPWAGIAIHLQVQVRKLCCDNPSSPQQIFSERPAGIARSSARRTERQREALLDVAVALGGEAGDSRPGSIVPKRVGLMT